MSCIRYSRNCSTRYDFLKKNSFFSLPDYSIHPNECYMETQDRRTNTQKLYDQNIIIIIQSAIIVLSLNVFTQTHSHTLGIHITVQTFFI